MNQFQPVHGPSQDAFDELNSKIGDIKNIAITAASRTASAIGASLEAILNTDCTFAGSISNGGKGTIVGYHYMASGNHYWTALVAWFGRNPIQYQGIAGTYTEYDPDGNIAADGIKIKHGRQAMRVNQSSSGYDPVTASVSFTTSFADANYHVVLTNTNGGGGDWNQIMISASSLTKDGFTIIANDNKVGSATNILVYVDWVAIHN